MSQYDGSSPLAPVLKAHFKKHPILGSRDRRLLSALLYGWYRAGKGLSYHTDITQDQQLLWQAALFLTQTTPLAARLLPPAWAVAVTEELAAKRTLLAQSGIEFDAGRLLPAAIEFSEGIRALEWSESMLQQPRLFLRMRQDHKLAEQLLKQQDIHFEWLSENCLSLPNGTDAEKLLPARSFVVQDASSQKTGAFFQPDRNEKWWDSCAGAGGKTLLLADSKYSPQITVSDVRPAILHNLKKRFEQLRLPLPQLMSIDAADKNSIKQYLGNATFDGIICDVPCSGSGTWARTPEQLYFFDPEVLKSYTQRQASILNNMPERLKPGGKLIYITCSVFKEENEAIVRQALENQPLKLVRQELINGIALKADSMFVAVMEKR